MLKPMKNDLAATFARYAERHDRRLAFLAHKAETKVLSDEEMTELILRMDRAQCQFFHERERLLG